MTETDLLALPSRDFAPRIYGVGAWTDNLHFAYDLIALLRPRLFVELGTDRGESYFAFCQSVAENNTGTHCVAIDTWRGDSHVGGYDETTFDEIAQHNQEHYAVFSETMRSTFDDARPTFDEGSIDLLHLDGWHTEEAVRHDLESWLPKLRAGGILLMHDVNVRARGFGVWKVWDELTQRGRAHIFLEGPGLGVWQKPPAEELPTPLENLLAGSPDVAAPVIDYYRAQAQAMHARIARHWRDGSIRQTAAAHQTAIQIFHTRDGNHREEDSVFGRVGHESWRAISIPLPPGAGAAPLRVDFLSAFTIIDIASIRLTNGSATALNLAEPAAFESVQVAGDAAREPHPRFLRIRVTGVDPQLHLPAIDLPADKDSWQVILRFRISAGDAPPNEK